MKNYKEHVTKGPAHAKGIEFVNGTGVFNDQGIHIAQVVSLNGADEILIAEAFNVLHETGMTPRELADLVAAFRKLADATEDFFQNMQEKGRGHAYRLAKQQAHDLLTKYQPKPVKG